MLVLILFEKDAEIKHRPMQILVSENTKPEVHTCRVQASKMIFEFEGPCALSLQNIKCSSIL